MDIQKLKVGSGRRADSVAVDISPFASDTTRDVPLAMSYEVTQRSRPFWLLSGEVPEPDAAAMSTVDRRA